MKKCLYFPNLYKMRFCFISFQVTHMDYTGQHRAFIMETFIKNESISTTQTAFHVYFGLGRYDPYLLKTWFYYGLLTSEHLVQHWKKIVVIPREMIGRVMDNFHERLRQCVDNNGKHLMWFLKWNKTKWHNKHIWKIKPLFSLFILICFY